jgi:hypothetical protein
MYATLLQNPHFFKAKEMQMTVFTGKKESLKKVQIGKIENVAGSV